MRPFNSDLGQFDKFDVVVVDDESLAVVTENEVISKEFYTTGERKLVIQYVDGPNKGIREYVDANRVKLSTMNFINIIGTDYLLDKLLNDKSGTTITDVNGGCSVGYEPYFLKFDPVKGQIPGSGN
jgi:uncharacterized membrane-anchored protein